MLNIGQIVLKGVKSFEIHLNHQKFNKLLRINVNAIKSLKIDTNRYKGGRILMNPYESLQIKIKWCEFMNVIQVNNAST